MANPFFPVESVTLTEEQKKEEALNNTVQFLIGDGRRLLEQTVRLIQGQWSQVWENGAFTPAEIVAKMGTDAVEIFRASALLTEAIYRIAMESPEPRELLDVKYLSAKYGYTANADGSITPNSDPGWTTPRG